MSENIKVIWLIKPGDNDYLASLSYLGLIFSNKSAKKLVKALRKAPITSFNAKDIFRSSGLSLLGINNGHVERNTEKLQSGIGLPPVLLVRYDRQRQLIIADGYHRLCSVYLIDEDADIPCKIV
ncbi:hypothetical protein [Flavobacterium sp. UBA6046]|jgi:hypothetical protein|uniref:hypothetical protein n=1 Tax=Flavobacterium sp. UBA6046 TaxID=1946552 RepID=UPI0025C2CCD0|nr:hypothetical protein [Flavobacterium sp. UBA6046]